jgi:hypothetical protein
MEISFEDFDDCDNLDKKPKKKFITDDKFKFNEVKKEGKITFFKNNKENKNKEYKMKDIKEKNTEMVIELNITENKKVSKKKFIVKDEDIEKNILEKEDKKLKIKKREDKFTLKNINTIEIDKKYISKDLFNSDLLEEEDTKTITSKLEKLQLSTLRHHPNDKIKNKNVINSNIYISIPMKDYETKNNVPKKTTIVCLNDQEPFTTEPFGLPIRYYPSILEFKSGEYTNKQPITKVERIKYQEKNVDKKEIKGEKEQKLIINEYYDTDGIFCSFGCMLCYFYKNSNNPLYKNSLPLIRQLIKDVCIRDGLPIPIRSIHSAPNIRLLRKNGGPLTIEEYRNISNHVDLPKIIFFDMNQVKKNETIDKKQKPLQKPIGLIFEQIEI